MRRAASLLAAVLALAGCGSPSADLFEVVRSGPDRNANVRLLVSDDGTVRCNRRKPVAMGAGRLLTARELEDCRLWACAAAVDLTGAATADVEARLDGVMSTPRFLREVAGADLVVV